MRKNIERVFNNLLLLSILLTTILAITAALSYKEENSYTLIETIQKEREIIDDISELDMQEKELSSIIAREKAVVLKFESAKIEKTINNDFYMRYMLDESYIETTTKLLNTLIENYSESLSAYYKSTPEDENELKALLYKDKRVLIEHLNSMLNKILTCSNEKYILLERLILISFSYSALMILWYRRKLKSVLDDIETHSSSSKTSNQSTFVDVKVEQSTSQSDTGSSTKNIDSYAQINNKFSALKPSDKNKIISLTLFELKEYETLKKELDQENLSKLIKKVLSIFSIYEKGSDISSYLEEGRFLYLAIRDEKEDIKKHAIAIFESINEAQFLIGNEKKHLNSYAALVIKKREDSLTKTMKIVEDELNKAKESDENKIKSPHIRF